jgi:hypothetical protein
MNQICEGTYCPSRLICKKAERPADRRAPVTMCALWVRRPEGEDKCDMFEEKEQK